MSRFVRPRPQAEDVTVGDARTAFSREIRLLDAQIGDIPEPSRTEAALAHQPIHPELVAEQARDRLLAMREPGLHARLDAERSAPVFALGDIASLGFSYAARSRAYRAGMEALERRIGEDARTYSIDSACGREVLSQTVAQAEARRQEVLQHAALVSRRRSMGQAILALASADAGDVVHHGAADSVDVLVADVRREGGDLAARARTMCWLEALERCGVSPRIPSPDPAGLGRSPLERLLRDEIAAIPGATAGPLAILDQPQQRRPNQVQTTETVRQAMDAIAQLRRQGLVSEDLVQGAAGAIVAGIAPEELPQLHRDLLEAGQPARAMAR